MVGVPGGGWSRRLPVGAPETAMEHLRAADAFGRAPRTHPDGSRTDGPHVATCGHPCSRNAALGGNQYLSPRPESLMDPARRVFPRRARWKYFTHTNRCGVLLSISVAVLVPKNFKCSSRPSRHIRALHISGQFSGGASSRRHGVRTVRTLVYCPKGDMTWHLAP